MARLASATASGARAAIVGGDGAHARQELGRLDDGVDESDAQRLVGVDEPRRCRCSSRAPRQADPLRAAAACRPMPGMTPRPTSGSPNIAAARRVDEVADQRQLAAAAQREAVDRRDHRHRERLDADRPARARWSASARAARPDGVRHGLDVGARDERLVARAGQDHAAHGWRRARARRTPSWSASQRHLVERVAAPRAGSRVTVGDGPSASTSRRSATPSPLAAPIAPAPCASAVRRSPAPPAGSGKSRGPVLRPSQPAATYWRRSGQGRYLGSPSSRCRTSRIASVVSRPMRSMSANGPIGWLSPRLMATSMSSTERDPLVQREAGLVEHRHQDAVDDEAGDVARDDGGLAQPLGERARRLVGRVRRWQAADDLDQLHERRRVHEVHADHAIGALHRRADGGDADRRRVGRQDRRRRGRRGRASRRSRA